MEMSKCEPGEKHIYVEGEEIESLYFFIKFGEKGIGVSSNMEKEYIPVLKAIAASYEVIAETKKVETNFSGKIETVNGHFFLFYNSDDMTPNIITNLPTSGRDLINTAIDKFEIACNEESKIICDAGKCTEIFNEVK